MHNDNYGRQILTEMDICNAYLRDPNQALKNAFVESKIKFADFLEIDNLPKLIEYQPLNISVEEFDIQLQSNWHMPKEYYDFDIAKWVLDCCKTEEELQRVGQELLMFQEREMFPLLRYCKYLVDTMRKNNIVWGVGRGSSVSSYVLYLIGIHKINSLYYDLDISEFLK
jgi:DNA polymerase III alpha subunit